MDACVGAPVRRLCALRADSAPCSLAALRLRDRRCSAAGARRTSAGPWAPPSRPRPWASCRTPTAPDGGALQVRGGHLARDFVVVPPRDNVLRVACVCRSEHHCWPVLHHRGRVVCRACGVTCCKVRWSRCGAGEPAGASSSRAATSPQRDRARRWDRSTSERHVPTEPQRRRNLPAAARRCPGCGRRHVPG